MSDKSKIIYDDEKSRYYLVNSGQGGFLNPPEHAEHNWHIAEYGKRGGESNMSLSCAIKESWIPQSVKSICKAILSDYPGVITEKWIAEVYAYFRHCYSPDGVDRNVSNCKIYGKFWGNAEKEKDENPERHLGYLFVKQFDPTHKPRTDLF